MTAVVLSFVIALALNGAFFAVAAARRTDVVTDLSYSLTFALLAVVLLYGLFGFEIAALYVGSGLLIAIVAVVMVRTRPAVEHAHVAEMAA